MVFFPANSLVNAAITVHFDMGFDSQRKKYLMTSTEINMSKSYVVILADLAVGSITL